MGLYTDYLPVEELQENDIIISDNQAHRVSDVDSDGLGKTVITLFDLYSNARSVKTLDSNATVVSILTSNS